MVEFPIKNSWKYAKKAVAATTKTTIAKVHENMRIIWKHIANSKKKIEECNESIASEGANEKKNESKQVNGGHKESEKKNSSVEN